MTCGSEIARPLDDDDVVPLPNTAGLSESMGGFSLPTTLSRATESRFDAAGSDFVGSTLATSNSCSGHNLLREGVGQHRYIFLTMIVVALTKLQASPTPLDAVYLLWPNA